MTTLGIWVLAVAVALTGSGIIVVLDDIVTTLRLADLACK